MILTFRFSSFARRLAAAGSVAGLLAFAASAFAQTTSAPTSVLDNSALHPPAGASVAIVEFADLECPACARANPTIEAAAAKYKIPWVRHDLIIQGHVWSPVAAVNARWFDTKTDPKGRNLGDAYRDEVFASQTSIYTVPQLNEFTQNFARNHNVALPFAVDPQKKLEAAVRADTDLSRRTGITHTPTIFIVTAHSNGAPYIEVLNIGRDLYSTIDQALADTKAAPAPARHTAKAAKK